MILSCAGASREGRLANQAAVELTGEGFGVMFCLAGIATGKSGFVQSAKDAARLALKLPVKIIFTSPTPLSPADQAMSKLLGGKCC